MTKTKITIEVDNRLDPTCVALVLMDSLHDYQVGLRARDCAAGDIGHTTACLRQALAKKAFEVEYLELPDEEVKL